MLQSLKIGAALAASALMIGGAQAQSGGGFLSVYDDEHLSAAPFYEFGAPENVFDGVSALVRNRDGLQATINANELRHNGAYTSWWVVFNDPRRCDTPCACGVSDLSNPQADVGLFFASGRVSDDWGQVSLQAETLYGELPDGFDQVNPTLNAPASRDAEVHLVLRTHGRASSDTLERTRQLSEFNGGCEENSCANVQVSVHPSPTCRPGRRR